MSSPTLPVTALVAATTSNGIGLNGGLPWRLPSEMKYFQRVTVGSPPPGSHNAVIMGRKTWESIPTKFRPLPNRMNLVVSRQGVDLGGAPLSSSYLSLESAIAASSTAPRTFLIGGAQLYSLALTSRPTLVDRVLLTRIISDLSCDTFLTDFTTHREEGKAVWRLASHEELEKWVGFEVPKGEVEEQGVRYHFEMWELAGKAPDSA